MERNHARASDGAVLAACRHGGHLLSWQTPDGRERLFLSPLSQPAPGVAIRGGVPVCFPQFSGFGPLPKHGFVRDRIWQCTAAGTAADGRARLTYALEADAATRALWPQAFRCELELLAAGDTLAVTLAVHNTGEAPLSFTGALHTYFAVTDLDAARVSGLEAHPYRDHAGAAAAGGGIDHSPDGAPLCFGAEVDRVYAGVRGAIRLATGAGTLQIEADGFPDAVIWNPGPEKGAALADLETGAWRRYVCVEAAIVRTPVSVAAGALWRGTQRVRVI